MAVWGMTHNGRNPATTVAMTDRTRAGRDQTSGQTKERGKLVLIQATQPRLEAALNWRSSGGRPPPSAVVEVANRSHETEE